MFFWLTASSGEYKPASCLIVDRDHFKNTDNIFIMIYMGHMTGNNNYNNLL